MAPAAACAVGCLPLPLTMAEPEGQGDGATTTGSAKIFLNAKAPGESERVKLFSGCGESVFPTEPPDEKVQVS